MIKNQMVFRHEKKRSTPILYFPIGMYHFSIKIHTILSSFSFNKLQNLCKLVKPCFLTCSLDKLFGFREIPQNWILFVWFSLGRRFLPWLEDALRHVRSWNMATMMLFVQFVTYMTIQNVRNTSRSMLKE